MNIDFAARRTRIAPQLGLTDEIVLVGAGHPIPKAEFSEQLLPFVAHQEYFYLTGQADALGGVIAYDPHSGPRDGWVSFVPEVTEEQRVWDGAEQLPGEFLSTLPGWLAARPGRKIVMLGAPIADVNADATRSAEVRAALQHARRPKETGGIELMKRCAAATATGYAALQAFLKPGVSERRMQVELEAGYFRDGAQTTGYSSIVGVGAQSAVFHGSPSRDRVATAVAASSDPTCGGDDAAAGSTAQSPQQSDARSRADVDCARATRRDLPRGNASATCGPSCS